MFTENTAKLEISIQSLYLLYTLESNEVKEQHNKILSQIVQPKLALVKLRNTIIPLAPIKEQSQLLYK